MMDISEIFFVRYKEAAGEGAVLELKMRLLADLVPELRQLLKNNLEKIEECIIETFCNSLTGDECQKLKSCRQLRNKILHCDFPMARTKLHELGQPEMKGHVRVARIEDDSSEGLELLINDVAMGTPARSQEVADRKSDIDAGILGWLMELGCSGDLERAGTVFREASGIIERLCEETSNREKER